jgi:hypothetical protein
LALLVVVWLESLCVAAMACALPGRRSDAVGALRRAQYLVLRCRGYARLAHFLVPYRPLATAIDDQLTGRHHSHCSIILSGNKLG